MKTIIDMLKREQVGKISEDEPLAGHTTMKVGGPAKWFIEPNSISGLSKTIDILSRHQMNYFVIGRGSNLLIPDSGIDGIVIKLGKGLDHLDIDEQEVRVGAGYSLIKLVTIISKQGLSGLEFAGGIPGSVGGAVYMNAGAHGSDIASVIHKAHILFPNGKMEWLSKQELNYSYRTSVLQTERPGICLEACFSLTKGDKENIVGSMQAHKDYRRNTQPWNYPCSGSIFRNPLPNHAGALIEEAGLKGYKLGGAMVSEKHANFIVNSGTAKTKDVLDLIAYIQKVIKEKYDIDMETEVEIIGDKEGR